MIRRLFTIVPAISLIYAAAILLRSLGYFCTNGRSLDVARAYIEAAGGTAVLFSWLKTVNRGFLHMTPPPHLRPFQPNQVATEPTAYEYRYQPNIENPDAPAEIRRIFTAYRRWAWP